MLRPNGATRYVIHVSHLALRRHNITQFVCSCKLRKRRQGGAKSFEDMYIAWVWLRLCTLPPVYDQAIALHLDQFIEWLIQEPNPRWRRRVIEHVEPDTDLRRRASIKLLQRRFEFGVLFNSRVSVRPKCVPEQPEMRRPQRFKSLELQ